MAPEPERFAAAHVAHVRVELRIGEVLDRLGRGGDKVGQYFAAVDATPAKGVVRHAVKLIPTDLGGHEAVDPAATHQLWQGSAVAKHIGQPDDVITLAKLLGEEARPLQQLAYQRLTAGDVAVRFQPHHPDRLEPPRGNGRLHTGVERRIILLEIGVDLWL